jgi:hypothetical protein
MAIWPRIAGGSLEGGMADASLILLPVSTLLPAGFDALREDRPGETLLAASEPYRAAPPIVRQPIEHAIALGPRCWEALGFVPDQRDGHTHVLAPSQSRA